MEYDVAIIGAGPGGSATAKDCAKAGLDVLLIEKRKEIGAPKRCGEGLSIGGMERAGIKPEPEWARQKIMGAYMFAPSGTRIDIPYKPYGGYVIERKIFDKRMAELAADAGATVRAGTRATELIKTNGQISGFKTISHEGEEEIKAKVVVAADGVESKVARWAGINTTQTLNETCPGAQFEMCNINPTDSKMLEFYFAHELAPGGYSWVFPKGEHIANVGICTRTTKENALYYLKKFINNNENLKKGSILEINTGNVPIGRPVENLSTDGLVVVGDAAHQVNAIHGGGIAESMCAGQTAAKTLVSAVNSGDYSKNILKNYDKEWFETEGKRLNRVAALRDVIDALSDKDFDYLAKSIDGGDLVKCIRGSKTKFLLKVFGKRPSLLKLIPKLMKAI